MSIDPSTKKADSTTIAGTMRDRERRKIESEIFVSVAEGPGCARSGGETAIQIAVTASRAAVTDRRERKSTPPRVARPAPSAPTIPPTLYDACRYWRTGRRELASII